MPQVDFYILPEATLEQRALFACRLIEKIYKLGHRVYVQSGDKTAAQALDAMLWSFNTSSFVPHQLADADASTTLPETAVQIGWHGNIAIDKSAPIAASTVLINLAAAVPDFFSRFQRISEIVVQAPEVLASTRNAWRHYQQHGCTLERHDLRATQR